MAEFLTTHGTSYNIEKIIIEAKRRLVLVSPYLQLSKTLFERLKDACNKGVSIKIVYGKDELKPNERNSLAELDAVELYYFDNLHAKCYFNEGMMVITSMNMYEFSEKNNREMGVLIDRIKDADLYSNAENEALSIIKSSEQEVLEKAKRFTGLRKVGKEPTTEVIRGYCIRCEGRIVYSSQKPYCSDCFSVWAQYKNPSFKENVCHCCGEYQSSSMEKPLCYGCYTINGLDEKVIFDDELTKIHNSLVKNYPMEKINKTDTYVYFNRVTPEFDVMILGKELKLKYDVRTPQASVINQVNTLARNKWKKFDVVVESDRSWIIKLSKGNSSEVCSIVESLRNSELYQ